VNNTGTKKGSIME